MIGGEFTRDQIALIRIDGWRAAGYEAIDITCLDSQSREWIFQRPQPGPLAEARRAQEKR